MKRLLSLSGIVLCGCIVTSASAQSYPSRPIRLIVPWSAGSGTDLMSRTLAQKMSEVLGQQIVVDNRGGAGAIIGTELAAKTPPDGYTLYIGGSVSMAISPALYAKVAYDPVRDFAPVCLVSQFYNALSVHPSVPARSVKEFIALAKSRPGELMMGSAGNGSTSHLAGELFKKMAAVNMVHIPYKSGGQLVVGVLSGESHVSFSPVSTGIPHVQSGKLRMLGVSSARRIASLPDMPTIGETVRGYEYSGWQGVLVPAGTPPDIITRLHAAIIKATAAPDFRDYLYKEGSEYVGSTPDQFAGFLRHEVQKNAELVKSAGIKPQ
ncbi:MAG TPA: tripartite tricarboxylate transporter substrate binding protein [Burkholderiales bacterium]|nr:tripartite tricarboxylate transporter substrate binding protein [Burkholderiales bacterium]